MLKPKLNYVILEATFWGVNMGILDFLRYRQQKSEQTSMVAKSDSSITPYTPKKKKIRNIVDFVENALINNGGDYDDIYQKLLALSEFSKHAKEYGIECNLGGIDVTLRDFFTEQAEIKHFPIKDKPYASFYAKKDGWNFYNYRGVTVMQDEQSKKPIMYYGRRNKNAETHRNDCIIAFGDDTVVLRDECKANYDEIPLWGNGTYAEFSFDENNHITRVKYRYMTHPRLGFWSDEQVCEFDTENKQYRLQPTQIPERTYNDPKPNKSSMKLLAKILMGSSSPKKDDEHTLDK